MIHLLSISILPVLMITAAVSDIASFRIPNWLTILTAALFFPMAWLTGMPLVDFGWHLAAGGILFVVGFTLFSFGLFGGGDAKLMAAAGLWFGTSQTMPFLVATALAGGALAAAVAVWSLFMTLFEIHGPGDESRIGRAAKKIRPKLPYGLAFAIGAIVAFPKTWWVVGVA